MNILQAIILGIVEGVTEFLPISSTGHMILTAKILGINQTSFVTFFEVVIQLGALMAVVILFIKKLFFNRKLINLVITSFIPTAVIGLIFHKVIKSLFEDTDVVIWSLLLGGVALLIVEYVVKKRLVRGEYNKDSLNKKDAFLVGTFQSLALIPGVSRSGATIATGLLLGISRVAIVEFSFMLSIPTVGAASALDFISHGLYLSQSEVALILIGFISAFVSAFICVKIFIKYISNHDFKGFAWYRIIIAILLMMFL